MSKFNSEDFWLIVLAGKVLLTIAAFLPTVFGIIILCKYRKYREFGISLILSGLIGVYTEIGRYFILSRGEEFVARTLSYVSIVAALMSFVSMILIFLYAKRNYESKGLPVVIAVPLGWTFLTTLIRMLVLNKMNFRGDFSSMNRFLLGMSFVGSLASIAIMIFIAVVYFKNKGKETYASRLWVFIMIIAIISAAGSLASASNIGIAGSIVNLLSYGGRWALAIYIMVAGHKERKEIA